MSRRLLRVGALGMAVVLAGCASAPPKPTVEAFEPESQPPAECTAQAPSGNGAARLGRAVGYGALGVFLGALQGAGDGASWAWGSGGSRSDADICANCGEEYVGEATTAHLLRNAEEVSRAGVEVDVREYAGP